jgi:predicted Zn-dependent peptidase
MTTIYAGTSAEEIQNLANVTIDEMKRAASDMSAAEVARARAQMKAGLLMGLESPSNRAERLARLLSIWDRIPSIEETIKRIDNVTTGDVREFAAHMAGHAGSAMALYGPASSAPSLDDLRTRLAA